MKFGIAIATTGRPDILSCVLPHVRAALRPGDRLVIVGAAPEDWPCPDQRKGTELLLAPRGSTFQRNAAIEHFKGQVEAIVFFDDDFLPRADWLDEAERLLVSDPRIAAFTGRVIVDGILGPGLSPQDRARLLAAGAKDQVTRVEDGFPSYGCNMGFRASAIGDKRFDERLRLYAWQEDVDFSARVSAEGRRVRAHALAGVHLGVKTGRVPGRKLGYAQIANPVYLMQKGTMRPGHALPLMARNVAANVAKSLRPEVWADRRGRLFGNLVALMDLCRGRVQPERVEQV